VNDGVTIIFKQKESGWSIRRRLKFQFFGKRYLFLPSNSKIPLTSYEILLVTTLTSPMQSLDFLIKTAHCTLHSVCRYLTSLLFFLHSKIRSTILQSKELYLTLANSFQVPNNGTFKRYYQYYYFSSPLVASRY